VDHLGQFKKEVSSRIGSLGADVELKKLSVEWARHSGLHKWSYNFFWMGRPAIQFPNDAWAMQELIWDIKPDLIIESGIAHGGSLVFYASMLALLDISEAVQAGHVLPPGETKRKVLGIDIDIRQHNREAIEQHPMSPWIEMIEGSSISTEVVSQVREIAKGFTRILVSLDSNHTHEHVLAELNAYAPLVTVGSYCVVFDTIIEETASEMDVCRPWGPGNNPMTAVVEYLKHHPEFEVDMNIHHKLLITVAPGGWLVRKSES